MLLCGVFTQQQGGEVEIAASFVCAWAHKCVLCAGADSFLMEPVFRGDVWDFMLKPVSKENEQAMCESMVAGCEAAMAGYSTSLADDLQEQAAMSPGDDPAKALALRIRMVSTFSCGIPLKHASALLLSIHLIAWCVHNQGEERRVCSLHTVV